MLVYFGWVGVCIGFLALVVSLIVLRKKNKSFSYLFFFSVFWVYMMGVISVVVFPFPIAIPNPDFRLSLQLIPFDFGFCHLGTLCLKNIYENILLTIPFGFGISFIAFIKPKNILGLALAVGFTFELVQLILSFLIKNSFRVIDINDVILNAIGVLLGYGTLKIFGWLYIYITNRFEFRHKYIFAYIYDVVR